MPGHNFLELINNDGVRTVAGKLFQVVSIGTATPNAANGVDVQGYARGAFLINSTGTSTANTVYVNLGTTSAATWTTLTVS
jgi:hypothetical protein